MPDTLVVTNGITMQQMADHAFFLADETDGANFPQPTIVMLLNMGIRRVIDQCGYPLITAKAVVAASRREYPLINATHSGGTDADIATVELHDHMGELIAVLPRGAHAATVTSAGEPTSYSVLGDSVFLSPVPTTTYLLHVTYRAEVPSYAIEDSAAITDSQAEAAIYYAVWQMKLKDDEITVSDRWREEFNDRLKGLTMMRTGVYKPAGR